MLHQTFIISTDPSHFTTEFSIQRTLKTVKIFLQTGRDFLKQQMAQGHTMNPAKILWDEEQLFLPKKALAIK
jgi:hypothetical protein|tara:strand:- start:375 stop:590 length:216 start_codon:yes stop_codon:yes gene_type:complete